MNAKRILGWVLCLVLCTGLLPVFAAPAEGVEQQLVEYLVSFINPDILDTESTYVSFVERRQVYLFHLGTNLMGTDTARISEGAMLRLYERCTNDYVRGLIGDTAVVVFFTGLDGGMFMITSEGVQAVTPENNLYDGFMYS
jgi:hypothetical protein